MSQKFIKSQNKNPESVACPRHQPKYLCNYSVRVDFSEIMKRIILIVMMGMKAIKKPLTRDESAVFQESRGDRTRTCDSLVPNQERYQLRYTSLFCGCKGTK